MSLRASLLFCLLVASCSGPPADPAAEESARQNFWREQAAGAFACRTSADLEAFLARLRPPPPHRPPHAGGGTVRGPGGVLVDDLYPLDVTFDLYVTWASEDRSEGIRSVEVVGFPDLRPKIRPEYFEALAALHRSPSAIGEEWYFDQVLWIRAVNALLALGNDAGAALKAYSDLAWQLSSSDSRKYRIDEYRIFPVAQILYSNPRRFMLGEGGVENPGARDCPLFPVLLEGGVPFLLVTGYTLSGVPEKPSDRLGSTAGRRSPLVPEVNPVEAVESLLPSSAWEALMRAQRGGVGAELKKRVRRQALGSLAALYRPPQDFEPKNCCGDPSDEEWRQIVQEVRALGLRWDAQRQDFVRSR